MYTALESPELPLTVLYFCSSSCACVVIGFRCRFNFYLQVERHLRKLDQEVAKFKMELEADNAGITEILEKRAYHFVLNVIVFSVPTLCHVFANSQWLV